MRSETTTSAGIPNHRAQLSRRNVLGLAGAVGAAGLVVSTATSAAATTGAVTPGLGAAAPAPGVPAPVKVTEGRLDVGGGSIWYWDTETAGPPVVLLHSGIGSGEAWPYQQAAFVRAGFRVISYSRRGSINSDPATASDPGTRTGDLHQLVNHLRLDRLHLLGVALGGIVAFDYACQYPERLASLTVACSTGGVQDPEYVALSNSLRPAGFEAMPPEFRELGPTYRAANPAGVAAWLELTRRARTGAMQPAPASGLTWAKLQTITTPTLLLTGDADLYTPPPILRMFQQRIPRSRAVVVEDCGHNPHWERPDFFNSTVTRFFANRR